MRSLQATPLISRTGTILGAIATYWPRPGVPDAHLLRLLDLLARQVADSIEFRRTHEELRESERYRALAEQERTARAEAEAALQARDEFLSIAAHELKTPVTGIKGSAQILQAALDRDMLDEARLRRYVAAMTTASDRLATLTNDLLDVARIQSGRLELDRAALDLRDLIREVVDRFRDGLDHGHILRLELPTHPCTVLADPARLEQVLVNLLDNAVKYSPDGGTIGVSLDRGADALLLRVQDSGIGVPEGALEKIFEPFGRASNAAQSHLPGMGLGLHICRTIVERHGGTLRAESDGENQGTTMIVTLPLACHPTEMIHG